MIGTNLAITTKNYTVADSTVSTVWNDALTWNDSINWTE